MSSVPVFTITQPDDPSRRQLVLQLNKWQMHKYKRSKHLSSACCHQNILNIPQVGRATSNVAASSILRDSSLATTHLCTDAQREALEPESELSFLEDLGEFDRSLSSCERIPISFATTEINSFDDALAECLDTLVENHSTELDPSATISSAESSKCESPPKARPLVGWAGGQPEDFLL